MTLAIVPIMDVPQMSLCSVCPAPGNCCKRMVLIHAGEGPRKGKQYTFWADTYAEDSRKWLAGSNGQYVPLPFEIDGINQRYTVPEDGTPEAGREYVTLWFKCPKLLPEGRCGIYNDRPAVCRMFVPGENALCVFHPDSRKAGEDANGTMENGSGSAIAQD